MRILLAIFSILIVSSLGVPNPSQPKLVGRIVGGKNASILDYPYQLSMESKNTNEQMCGAVIISNDWAITAAHCLLDLSAEDVTLRAGSSIKGEGGSLHPAEIIISHPNYRQNPTDFDIAVVKVSVPFIYGPGVENIPLINKSPDDGEMATITGWGATDASELKLPRQLQVANIPIVDHNKCNDVYRPYGGITDDMLCAGLDQGGIDACVDDSGGPLVVEGKLAGIVSFGIECALAGIPGIYANVALLRDFIVSETGIQ